MPSIKSKNSKRKYTRKNKYNQNGLGNNNNTINNIKLKDFTEKYRKELDELRSYYIDLNYLDLSTLDKIISYESNNNLKYLKYIIKKEDEAMFKNFNEMYKKEYTFKEYVRRKLGLANPSKIVGKEYLSSLFTNNKKLLNPTQFPPSKPANKF